MDSCKSGRRPQILVMVKAQARLARYSRSSELINQRAAAAKQDVATALALERPVRTENGGATFPDYELSDQTAKHRKLSELQGSDPMVLVLSRGAFCPKDRRQAEGLVELHREIEVGYCRLVTISTDNLTETNEYRSGVGAHWPFLSDPRRTIQKDLDIAEYTDPLHNPMIPHVIVLEPGLVIHKIYSGYWFFGRPTMEELRQDLRAVTKKCRPDWDITTPELKAAWQQGRKEMFYPYGKTFAQTIGEQD
jgi:peroxiredoxin